jgi:hypothetical protein
MSCVTLEILQTDPGYVQYSSGAEPITSGFNLIINDSTQAQSPQYFLCIDDSDVADNAKNRRLIIV